MDSNDKEKILDNFDKLIELTECDGTFLSKLLKRRILGIGDFDTLISIRSMMKRASKLYTLLITRKEGFANLLLALRETCQDDVLQILQSAEPQPSSSAECREEHTRKVHKKLLKRARVPGSDGSVSFRVIAPSVFFTGREKELTDLHKIIYSNNNATTVISQVGSVTGLGGIGKTQLAKKYIQSYGKFYDNNTVWIDAANEEETSENFKRLASDVLGISLRNTENNIKDISVIINDCYQYFKNSKCIFVFDNVEKGDYIQQFLPNNKEWVSLLITSRQRKWWGGVEVLNLKVLQEEEAIELVQKNLGTIDDNITDIKALVVLLHYFPLALQQAASYIRSRRDFDNYIISDYLRDFKTHEKTLLESDITYDIRSYMQTTFTTWQVSVADISVNVKYGRFAIEILNLMAYMEPNNIPREVFMKIGGGKEMEIKLAVNLLEKYSLIDGTERQSVLSIHRLVQQVTRIGNQINTLAVYRKGIAG